MLEANGLYKRYGKKEVLQNTSFEIGSSEMVSIMGPSGGGKSTVARILCGTVMPDEGSVTFNNEMLVSHGNSYANKFRLEIQLIPQQPFASLDPRQTVGSAVEEPLLFHNLVKNKTEAREKTEELLEKVMLESSLYDRRPGELSGGQAQRILIARSLTLSPKLLIADEATSMLDISSQAQIVRIFKSLIENDGLSILFISHDRPLVESVSDRIYHLYSGKMKQVK
ncbi:MAG: dipeptide/oligopeptide/nickel ABC transporter ATP-binding protein [Candidatus Metalachnospira sp.]|nr:dipeptide/oligopeptide/nickel ABC transporter ATP-binding protein [Candidatus Metalachnospira sp.]